MSCNIDGCEGKLIVEDIGKICVLCGGLQGAKTEGLNESLISYSNTVTCNAYVRHHVTSSTRSFNIFTKLYLSLTLKLGTSFVLSEQGEQMLPKLWERIQSLHHKRKKEMLAALLFLLYNQERLCFSVRQFQKRLCLNLSKLSRCIEFVRKLFNFPSNTGNMENSTADYITELSKIVLNNIESQMQKDISKLAQRLAKVAHAKNWATKSNKFYIEQVSCASTIIAAHYFASEMKDNKLKSGKRCHFRYVGINLDKVASCIQISKRRVFSYVKSLQEALFAYMQLMPVKPGCVKDHKNVGMVLVDILNYADLDLELDDAEDVVDFVDEQFVSKKGILTAHLHTFLNSSGAEESFNMQTFTEFLQIQWKVKEEFSEDNSISLDIKQNAISIGKYQFHAHHIQLLKELIIAGCSLKELNSEKHSQLIKNYLEKDLSDDSDLEDLDDDEDMDLYIKTATEIEFSSNI